MRVNVSIKGDDVATQHLRQLASRVQDASPLWPVVAEDLMRDERERFSSRGFGRWKPNAKSTIRAKHSSEVMVRTGTLRRALTVRNAEGQRLVVGPHEMLFGLEPKGKAYYGRFQKKRGGRVVVGVRPAPRKRILVKVRGFIVHGSIR